MTKSSFTCFLGHFMIPRVTVEMSHPGILRQGSTHRLVRAPLGASWCDIFRFLLVLVRCGPSFSKKFRYWCGAVRNFEFFFGPGAVRSEFLKIVWSWCGAVRNSEIYSVLVRCGTKIPME